LTLARFAAASGFSELPWSVDVGAVFDGHDLDAAVLVQRRRPRPPLASTLVQAAPKPSAAPITTDWRL
jgi:hypothetical protein